MKQLRNAPLVEALLELKWASIDSSGQAFDPGYPSSVGRLYEHIKEDYPVSENLVPQPFVAMLPIHIVQQRFRQSEGQWPLVQIGPGILTLNLTKGYTWEDFERRANKLLPKLFEVLPSDPFPTVNSLLLRYINAIDFDYQSSNVLEFLGSKLRTGVKLPDELFRGVVEPQPAGLRLQLSFPLAEPKGILDVAFATGLSNDRPVVVWELVVRSQESDVPAIPMEFNAWLKSGHDILESWFFDLAKGDLMKRFSA